MRRLVNLSAVALLTLFSAYVFADELKSGLPVGESVGAFNVKDCTGPAQGKDPLCYRCRYGDRPVVCVFAREMTDELSNLVKQIDNVVAKNEDKKMAAFVVMLTNDQAGTESKLKAVAEKQKIENVPLTVFDGVKGPSGYKISADADVTVMMWEKGSVKATHSFAKGKLNKDAVAKVAADTAKILN